MSNPLAVLRDTLFASVLAFDAVYVPPGGGAGVACRILFNDEESLDQNFGVTGAVARTVHARLRLSEIAAPAKGGTIAISAADVGAQSLGLAGTVYAIAANPMLDRKYGTALCPLRALLFAFDDAGAAIRDDSGAPVVANG